MHSAFFNINDIVRFKVTDEDNTLSRLLLPNICGEYDNYRSGPIHDDDLDFTIRITRKIHGGYPANSYILDDKFTLTADSLSTEDRYKLATWRILIRNLEKSPSIEISPNLFGRLFVAGFFGDFFIQASAARKNIAIVHSSGTCQDGKAHLFVGRGGSGKTTIAMKMIEQGFQFLGDDFIFVRNGMAIPYVTPLNLFDYNMSDYSRKRLSSRQLIGFRLKRILFFMTGRYAKFFTRQNPMKAFPESIGGMSRIERVHVIMPTTADDMVRERISRETALQYMMRNQMMDSKQMPRYALEHGFIEPKGELGEYWDKYQDTLKANFETVAEYWLVKIPLNEKKRDAAINRIIGACVVS